VPPRPTARGPVQIT
jgi:hypothetical protein